MLRFKDDRGSLAVRTATPHSPAVIHTTGPGNFTWRSVSERQPPQFLIFGDWYPKVSTQIKSAARMTIVQSRECLPRRGVVSPAVFAYVADVTVGCLFGRQRRQGRAGQAQYWPVSGHEQHAQPHGGSHRNVQQQACIGREIQRCRAVHRLECQVRVALTRTRYASTPRG